MDTDRRISKEPREESQLLQVIGKTVGHHDTWRLEAGLRVADFKVILATRDLPGVAPGRSAVDDLRIVHPLGRLMGYDCRVVRGGNEASAHVDLKRRVGLELIGPAGLIE